ncbi:MAG: GAF domain-containing protein, partial [Anaerolineae bacterium]|nr:GAF domain-containing protein [Anaerolineae bacterium]
VAFYRLESLDPLRVTLKAQDGPSAIQTVAPKHASADDIMTWVAKNRQSRIAGPGDSPNHPLVTKNRFGAVACVPVVFSSTYYGVLVAFREAPGSIDQENVVMLELVSAQLAAAVSREIVS